MLCASLKNAKPGSLGTLFLLALCGGCIWRADAYLQPQLTVLDYPDSHYAGRRLQVEQVEAAKHYLTRDDKVFIVSMTQQGVGWFQLYYEFYPDVAVDYSFGAGEEFSPDIVRPGRRDAGVLYGRTGGLLHQPAVYTRGLVPITLRPADARPSIWMNGTRPLRKITARCLPTA